MNMIRPDLIMPRRLAVQILHEAQIAQPESICGIVVARNDEPCRFSRQLQDSEVQASGDTVWARMWSVPDQAAIPGVEQLKPGNLYLMVSLNTKGVLEMRAWELDDESGERVERVLKVRD